MPTNDWAVYVAESAETDMGEILNFVFERDGLKRAKALLKKFMEGRSSLASMQERGHYPPEMKRLNIMDYREIHVERYRLIYHVDLAQKRVVIHAVFDGRRHMDELLQKRLLRVPNTP